MQLTSQIIADNSKTFPELDYYYLLIEKAHKNQKTNPDICIEACKSLIEGICKTILFRKNASTYSNKYMKKVKFDTLLKDAFDNIIEFIPFIEPKVTGAWIELIRKAAFDIAKIRNDRGDICHGRHVPKTDVSLSDFAFMIYNITDNLAFYIIKHFCAMNKTAHKTEDKDVIDYEENEYFNNHLDAITPLGDKVLYSKALYEQDYNAYMYELEQYNIAFENEEDLS